MLERLAGHAYYYFLDGYFGYNQIAIAPIDQKKTNFTCPYAGAESGGVEGGHLPPLTPPKKKFIVTSRRSEQETLLNV